jgi:RNA polymerase sigma factor (sigma-70 family)
MAQLMAGSTDPELLRRVAALWDNPAWAEFLARYDPLVCLWCSRYGLDAEAADELRQRIWVELARRMPAYQYDPGGSFRAWLRRLCQHRAIDLIRERRDRGCLPLGEDELVDRRSLPGETAGEDAAGGEAARLRLALFREAKEAQASVRSKVKPMRWEAFWRVAINGEPVAEAAAALGVKYATAYAAVRHVAGLLREEGVRRRPCLGLTDL